MKKSIIIILFTALLAAFLPELPGAQALTATELSGQGSITNNSHSADFPYISASLVNDSGTIYFIRGATKIPFTNYQAFKGFGYSLKNVVKGDVSNYILSQDYVISTAKARHPWGQWLSQGNTVYYSIAEGLIPVPTAEIFKSNGGQWNLVVKANTYDLAALNAAPNLPILDYNDPRMYGAQALNFSGTGNAAPQPVVPSGNTAPQATIPAVNPDTSVVTGGEGILNLPTLSASSPAGQFVLSESTSQQIAVFNFTASGNPIIIQELDFNLKNVTNSGIAEPVPWVSVAGASAPVLYGATSSLSGLNISVPANAAGVSVPVTVSYARVNPPVSPSNQVFNLILTRVKYLSAGKTVSLDVSISSHAMNLVSSIPTVSIASPSGSLMNGLVPIALITVSARGGGGITLDKIPLSITSVGNAKATSSPNNLAVTDNGTPVATTNDAVSLAAGGSCSTVLNFKGDNYIAAGTSKTYQVALPIEGAVGSSAGSSAITTVLGGAEGFIFDDTAAGTSGANIAAKANNVTLQNYPANSAIVHN